MCSLITPQDTPAPKRHSNWKISRDKDASVDRPNNPGFDEQTNHSQCNTGIQRKLFRRGAGHGMSSGFILNLKSSIVASDINGAGFRGRGRGRGGSCR